MAWIFFGALTIAGSAVVGYIKQQNGLQLRQKSALLAINQLKNLIGLIQKHRGTCATYLQGDHGAKPAVIELRQQIMQVTNRCKQSDVINVQDRWFSFADHWQRLELKALNLSVNISFEQHTELISNLLFLLEDIAESQGFNKLKFAQLPNINMLWRELPLTVEYIGQARAVGVAVATSKVSTQIDKVKLGYLHKKINQLSEAVFQHINANETLQANQLQLLEVAQDACKLLTEKIQQELIDVTQVKLSPDSYFALASNTMQATNRLLELELQCLSDHIT